MQLNEIKARIADLRFSIEELADDCFSFWRETHNPHQMSVAEYLQYELTAIACKLSDLEETEESEEQVPTASELSDMLDDIEDWWSDLDLCDKSELANVPYPTTNYGRGDEYCECEERCGKWWNSRTYEQKKEIHDTYEEYTEE